MLNVLVPVDGSDSSHRAVRHLIDLVKNGERMEVHLVNVQPILSGHVSMFVTAEMVENFRREEGEQAAQAARGLLDEAGVGYVFRIEAGHIAETLAQYAQDHDIDKIVMGTRGMGAISNLVLGSVATKVIHLATVPVTLVK